MTISNTAITAARADENGAERGPLPGLRNLLANETRRWWRSRRWLTHLLIWVGVINGFLVFLNWAIGRNPDIAADNLMATRAEAFSAIFPALLHFTALAAIIAALGAIVGERQRGTAAWLLSKPVSRGAFVLAKLIAYATALVPLTVLAPAAIFYGERASFLGAPPAPGPLLAIVGLASLHLVWYLSLTLLLGTLARGHGMVAGVGLGVLFGGQLVAEIIPALAAIMPHGLIGIARALSLGQPLPAAWPLTLGVAVATTLAMIALALWRFGREEF